MGDSTGGDRRNLRGAVCVLAGGRSRRFGRDKATLRVEEEPILTWLRRRVIEPMGMASVVSLPPADEATALPPGGEAYDICLRDQRAFEGPLPAMADVLAQWVALGERRGGERLADTAGADGSRLAAAGVKEPWAGAWDGAMVFLPVDMPAMTVDGVQRRVAALGQDGVAIAMARWADGERAGASEPFPLACDAAAGLAMIQAALADGVRSVRDLAEREGVACVPLSAERDGVAQLNVNREADGPAVERALGVAVG